MGAVVLVSGVVCGMSVVGCAGVLAALGGGLLMLYGVNTFLAAVQTYRYCWLRSRPGSGKTALAFRLAYELVSSGRFRYILSNCRSVWADGPESVVLREGQYVDAVLILDEGGMFLDYGHKAKRWLAYLRKMNLVVLLPSVMKPAIVMRSFSVKRIINWEIIGVPVWTYRYRLSDAEDISRDFFHWVNPAEIYGVYDTQGFPSDGAGLEDWLLRWTKAAAAVAGYESFHHPTIEPNGGLAGGQTELMESLRGVAAAIEESSQQDADLVSIFQNARRKG